MLLYIAVAGWLTGLLYATYWESPGVAYAATAIAALGALLIGRADRRLVLAASFMLALTLGAVRMDTALSSVLRQYAGGGEVQLRGVVEQQRSRGVYLLAVDAPARGTVLLLTRRGSKLRPGDLLVVHGNAVPEAEMESFEKGLARATGAALVVRAPQLEFLDTGRGSRLSLALSGVRTRATLLLERHLPRRYSPVAEGLMLGGSLRLDPDVKLAFRRSGTAHVLAASGYNVSIVAGLLLALLRPVLGARRALPLVLLAIFVYAGLAGFSSSIVRAALMGAIGVGALWAGRPRDSGRALFAAALAMTVLEPGAVFDIGAQLSFAATAGLVWLYPVISRSLGWIWRPLREAFGIALTAQVTTLPLGLFYFGGLSAWAVPANMIIAPLVPVGMLLSAATMVAALLWSPLGMALGWVTTAVLAANVGVAQTMAALPASNLQTSQLDLFPVLLYYSTIVLVLWLSTRPPRTLFVALRRAGT